MNEPLTLRQRWAVAYPLGDVPVRAAALWPDAEAIVLDEHRRTYARVEEGSETAARSLRALGVGPGDIVAIYMANSIDYPEIVFGTARLGAVPLLLNARYRGDELRAVLADAGPTVVVTMGEVAEGVDFVQRLREGLPSIDNAGDGMRLHSDEVPALRSVVVMGDAVAPMIDRAAFEAGAAAVDPVDVEELRRRVAIRDVGMMMYTSGTTSRPKGCVMSHEMVVRNCIAGRHRLLLSEEDRLWAPLPMFHMSAILPLIACFDAGTRYVTTAHFDAGKSLAALERERVTHGFFAFHTLVQALVTHPAFRTTDLSALRSFNTIGPPETLRRVQELFPQAVQIAAYGLTEAGGVACFNELTDSSEQRATTSGRTFPGIEVRAVDPETGAECGPGERGELRIRGYSLLERYHNDPDRTAEAFDAEGWFRTGDLGSIDPDGRVTYISRLKDMLKVGGENVAAVEIETLLESHPAVSICQVVGVPDEHLDEVPVAFVELLPDQTAAEEDLILYCRRRIASFKVPRSVRVIDEWPMSATKIQKFVLRQQLIEEMN
jgi:fatty-acyl-CoA synthase